MKILVAPNSMKGSLNAFDFANIVEQAFLDCSSKFEIRKIPVADGGDFTGEILRKNKQAENITCKVEGPLGNSISANYARFKNTAIIEMADASGMKLISSEELNPMKASSFGTGQLIKNALENKCTEIWLAIGGSATVDGGMGMMEALGFTFFDKNMQLLRGCGENMALIYRIEKPAYLNDISIQIISDVDNPLLGENGAAKVFGPQKGATPKMVELLETGLKNWAQLLKTETGFDGLPVKGMGAAGGISAPLCAYFNAKMVAGTDFVLNQLNFEEEVKWADLVITGEGKIDSQTLNNKAPFGVLQMAKKYNKPVFAIGGKIEKEGAQAFDAAFSLVNGPLSLEMAIQNVQNLLYDFSFELAKTINQLMNITHAKI